MSDPKEVAAKALSCLDLTNLNDDCNEEDIRTLCARAATPFGPVAAICIWPKFVAQARGILGKSPIRIATVVNFPEGNHTAADVIALTEAAVRDGADEIDMVIPYTTLLEGHPQTVPARVARVVEASGSARVKAILETGVLGDADLIREAAELAIDGGADFIKTSTGKVPVNATPQAVSVMLDVISKAKRPVGLKPAGGVKTTADAETYLDLCADVMGPDWATPETFRFGASGVLDALLATLSGADEPVAGSGY